MRSLYFLVFLVAATAWAQEAAINPTSADAIMARVAANQDRAESLRAEYVYRQHVYIAMRKPGGKLMREEDADYEVIPDFDGFKKERKRISGRYRHTGASLSFTGEPVPNADSLDGELIKDFRDDLTNDKSKDGLGRDLFPLTSAEQAKYAFQLLGEEEHDGRKAYRIGFRPKDKNDLDWAGEALIDGEDYQPIRVFTKLSRKIPFAIRTFLGTNLPGIGFNVNYHRQADGVWFPSSFGTEFRLRAVFFINRLITISLENTDFKRTHVESRIKSAQPEEQ
jgi:hypothetical protein